MKHIKKIQLILLMLCGAISCTATAAYATQPTLKVHKHHVKHYKGQCSHNEDSWFVGVGYGRSWSYLRNSQSMVSNGSGATPPWDKDYYSIKTPSPESAFQFDLGYRWHKKRKFAPYYAAYLQYRRNLSTYIKGNVYQYSMPDFENYDYQMRYSADLLTLNGKVDLFEYRHILPYLAAGVGVLYNHVTNYKEYPLENVTPRYSPAYAGNTDPNLAVVAGVGVDIKFTKNVWGTLGYEYIAQGSFVSGDGDSTWAGTYLRFGKKARMSTAFFNLSVNIPDGIRSNA